MAQNTTPSFSNIEGASATTPGIKILAASIPATVTELPAPSSWTPEPEWWQEEYYDYTAKDEQRTGHKVSRGFRFRCRLDWDYLDKSNRQILVKAINQSGPAGLYVRFYPHSGQTNMYYDCYVTGYNISSYVEGIPIGYGPAMLIVKGRELRAEIPIYESHYHFTDSDESGGAYESSDEIVHFCDSDYISPAEYDDTDKIGYFVDTTRRVVGA